MYIDCSDYSKYLQYIACHKVVDLLDTMSNMSKASCDNRSTHYTMVLHSFPACSACSHLEAMFHSGFTGSLPLSRHLSQHDVEGSDEFGTKQRTILDVLLVTFGGEQQTRHQDSSVSKLRVKYS